MTGTKPLLDQIEIQLKHNDNDSLLSVYIDIFDNSLSRKWLTALNHLISNNYHLEKNYCFFGFAESPRTPEYILDCVNRSILSINQAQIGYVIEDYFTVDNTVTTGPIRNGPPNTVNGNDEGGKIIHDKMNMLHRYFEDLQGQSGKMSPFYQLADSVTRWHIRQLNLLCHEYESLILSRRKKIQAPEWQRPSQLMCWLNAPRFLLEESDYELFGIDSINRPLGGVFVGVNKSVGKHHWEVFVDEGRDVSELTTTSLISQTEAAGDFDIEWAQDPEKYSWQKEKLLEFRQWLLNNNFDPEDRSLTIGHPQVGQVDLMRTFGTEDYQLIWNKLEQYLNVYKIRTSDCEATYEYNWNDDNFMHLQIERITKGN
jgi:hypothetical protein